MGVATYPREEGVKTPCRTHCAAAILGAMGFFKRQKSAGSPCPRCSQLVTDDQLTCPMCGWDQRDAYQGPKTAEAETLATSGSRNASADGG
jgi:hypothetical protein